MTLLITFNFGLLAVLLLLLGGRVIGLLAEISMLLQAQQRLQAETTDLLRQIHKELTSS